MRIANSDCYVVFHATVAILGQAVCVGGSPIQLTMNTHANATPSAERINRALIIKFTTTSRPVHETV